MKNENQQKAVKENELSTYLGDVEVVDASELKYEKSNVLVNSFYNMSSPARKMVNYALTYFRKRKFTQQQLAEGLERQFSAKELKENVFPHLSNRNSIYIELDTISDALTNTRIIRHDANSQRFEYINFIEYAKYENGVFSIKFSPSISKYIANLGQTEEPKAIEQKDDDELKEYTINNNPQGFTVFEYNTNIALKSIWGIAMYELLESKKYRMRDGRLSFEISILDLKLLLGIIDTTNTKVQNILNKKNLSDEEKLNEISKLDEGLTNTQKLQKMQVHKYKKWSEFERQVLKTAKEDFDQCMEKGVIDFNFMYQGKKTGKNKVTIVRFDLFSKQKWHQLFGSKQEESTEENEQPVRKQIVDKPDAGSGQYTVMDISNLIQEAGGAQKFIEKIDKYEFKMGLDMSPIDDMLLYGVLNKLTTELFNQGITEQIKDKLMKASDKNINVILKNIKYIYSEYKIKGEEISNLPGLLIKACADDYYNNRQTVPGDNKIKASKNNKFGNFNQRDYDYDELMKSVLSK